MKLNYRSKFSLIIVIILFICISSTFALDWPVFPDSTSHKVSYFYGGWQGMWRAEWGRNVNYFHNGIDIPGDTLGTVYAVESGYVKAIITIFDSDYHWRIIIADSSGIEECQGWLYAHIIPESIPFSEGDYVNAGDSIGVLVTWGNPTTPVHLHFSRIQFAGNPYIWANGYWDYQYPANPLNYLNSPGDTMSPFLENAWEDQLFAFCENQTSNYFDEGEPVSGDVDIICSAYDNGGFTLYKTSPYKIEYKIEGDSSIPWTISFEFSGWMDAYNGIMENLSHMVYKYDSYCLTTYSDSLRLFYIMTNSDGDGILEVEDSSNCWVTTNFHNGDYKIFTRLSDYDGNTFIDSMMISVDNSFEVNCNVSLDDGNPYLNGSSITIQPDNRSDTSNSLGELLFTDIGGGVQQYSISRLGYITIDTVLLMNQDTSLYVTMVLDDYICGDIDADGSVPLVSDLVYAVDYLFKGGPPPPVIPAANVDGNAGILVSDLVYLVDYLFKGGQEPVCE